MLDAAVLIRYEVILRPDEKHWPAWVAGQMGKARRRLDALESKIASFKNEINIGTITLGCVARYLDFCFLEEDWRATRPHLRDWYASFSTRDSMAKTKPETDVEV